MEDKPHPFLLNVYRELWLRQYPRRRWYRRLMFWYKPKSIPDPLQFQISGLAIEQLRDACEYLFDIS